MATVGGACAGEGETLAGTTVPAGGGGAGLTAGEGLGAGAAGLGLGLGDGDADGLGLGLGDGDADGLGLVEGEGVGLGSGAGDGEGGWETGGGGDSRMGEGGDEAAVGEDGGGLTFCGTKPPPPPELREDRSDVGCLEQAPASRQCRTGSEQSIPCTHGDGGAGEGLAPCGLMGGELRGLCRTQGKDKL